MVIKCEERYREAMAHAEATGDKTLQECFETLKLWESQEGFPGVKVKIELWKDFAPLSFLFNEIFEDGRVGICGGIIYHGNPDTSRSFQIEPKTGWLVHT